MSAELSVNLEIKGIGKTELSMSDAKKLYEKLGEMFSQKVVYVGNQWRWNNPYNYDWLFGSMGQYSYNSSDVATKGIREPRQGFTSTTGESASYNISI